MRSRFLLGAIAATVAATAVMVGLPGADPLGPADGHDLPAVDTGRVAVGDRAPDFTLEAYGGSRVSLSDFRGGQDVILVFYRGRW